MLGFLWYLILPVSNQIFVSWVYYLLSSRYKRYSAHHYQKAPAEIREVL